MEKAAWKMDAFLMHFAQKKDTNGDHQLHLLNGDKILRCETNIHLKSL